MQGYGDAGTQGCRDQDSSQCRDEILRLLEAPGAARCPLSLQRGGRIPVTPAVKGWRDEG